MSTQERIAQIERAINGRLTIKQLCQDAEIDQSTWCRWKSGQEPNLRTWKKVEDALERKGILVRGAA